MGAGAGAAAPVDNDLSPRFAAIEKAQAELRQEVAVRDERRRELEFLEKGGNPLDFQVGDVINPFRSSTDPLADQLLPIKCEASNSLQVGGVDNESYVHGSTGINFTDVLENQHIWSVLRSVSSGGNLESDAKVCSTSKVPHDVVGTRNELNPVKGIEPGRGSWTAARGQSYIRRNRHRVKWDAFSDVNAKGDIEDPLGNSSIGSVTGASLSFENVLPVDTRSQAPLTADGSGNKETYRVNARQCSPMNVSVQHGNADELLVSVPVANSTKGWTQPFKSNPACPHVDEDNAKGCLPSFSENKGDLSRDLVLLSSASQGGSLCSLWKTANVGVQGDVEGKLCQPLPGPTCGIAGTNCKLNASIGESDVIRTAVSEGTCKDVSCKVTCGFTIASDGHCKTKMNQTDPLVGDLSAASVGVSKPPGKRLDTATPVLLAAKSEENLLPGEVIYGPENLTANFESYVVPFAPELPIVEPDTFELKDQGFPHLPLSSPADDCRFQNQSTPVLGALTGLSRSNSRTSHLPGSSGNRFPGVVLPWEKEQDPLVIAETERRKATISAAAKKAQEDCILEEAETIMASRLQVAELDRRKPFHEPGRRKSHWDFVLEEMVWMANDFMQERLWKSAAAAQFCNSVTVVRVGCKAPKKNVIEMQRLLAQKLANAVVGYWRSITDSVLIVSHKVEGVINSSDGLAPMDVDAPESKEGLHSRSSTPLREYCIRHMKDYMTRKFGSQVEAPCTPDRTSEQRLVYTRLEGAFEIYRESVMTHWAMIEAEHEQVRQELNFVTEAEADAEGVGEELVNSDVMAEAGYMTRLSSPRRVSSDEEVYSHNLTGNVIRGGSMVNTISKKKRNFFEKTMPAKLLESLSGQGLSLNQPVASTAHMDYSFPSVSTGKRSLPSSAASSVVSVGTIPIKRLRTSAVAARQRAAGMSGLNLSPSIGGLLAGGRLPPGLSHLQQQQESLLANSTGNLAFNGDSGPRVVQSAPSNLLFSKSKKKKKKYLSGAVYKGNLGDVDAVGPRNSSVKREHLKRKRDGTVLLGPSSRSSEGGSEDFDSPGTPGAPNKKTKLFKPPDASPDLANSAGAAASQGATQISVVSSKLVRQNYSRDRSNRKAKPIKVSSSQPGSGIPWSAAEDQAILHLVQSLGPNWELVSDVLRFNAHLKGIFRKPKHCREHHRFLVEQVSGDSGESPNNLSVVQHSSSLPGSTKQCMQSLLEDTGKLHFEHIVHLVQKHHLCKLKNVGHTQKQHVQIHPSHANIMAQYCAGGITGVYCTPLELCERSSTGDLTAQQYQMQPHGGGLGLPNVLSGCSSLRGMPMLPGLQLSPPVTPSSVTVHTSTAREGQRSDQMRPFLHDETNQMRLARVATLQRGLQLSVTSVSAGMLSVGPSDCNGPGLPTGSAPTSIAGLKRGMSLPRPGLSGLSPSMTSAGFGSMLPPGGVGINTGGLDPGAVVPAQMSIVRRPRDLVQLPSGRPTEEQRQILQELQHQAEQGNAQAAVALSTFNSNNLISSPSQTFGAQLQSPQPQVMPLQHQQSNQLQHSQQQTHAYYVAQAAKERQLQQQQQQTQRLLHQHQIRQNSNSVQQSSCVGQQQQHVQGHVHPQQSHVLPLQPPVCSPQQLSMQQQKQLLPPSSVPSSSLQQQPSLPPPTATPLPPMQSGGASAVIHGRQQVVPTPQTLGHGKLLSTKQVQKHQQVPSQGQSRVLKNSSRGGSMMQMMSQAASSSGLSGHVTMTSQVPSQQVGQSIQGPRSLLMNAPMHVGKLTSQASPQVLTSRVGGQLQAQGTASTQVQGATQSMISSGQQKQQQLLAQNQVSGPMPGKQQPGPKALQIPAAPAVSTVAKSTAAGQQPLLAASPRALVSGPAVTSPSATGQPPVLQQQHQPPSQQSNTQLVSTVGPSQPQHTQNPSQRRQHQQPGYRRVPLRQTSSSILQQVPVQVTKSATQQVASQNSSQPVQVPFPLSPTTSSPLGLGVFNSGVAMPSPLSSSTVGVHSQWKPSQPLAPVSAGMHNPEKVGNAGGVQINTSGSAVEYTGANTGASLTSMSMITHGVDTNALGRGAHGHNLGLGASGSSRVILSAQGPVGLRPSQDSQLLLQQSCVSVKTVESGPAWPPSSISQNSCPSLESDVAMEAEGVRSGQAASS